MHRISGIQPDTMYDIRKDRAAGFFYIEMLPPTTTQKCMSCLFCCNVLTIYLLLLLKNRSGLQNGLKLWKDIGIYVYLRRIAYNVQYPLQVWISQEKTSRKMFATCIVCLMPRTQTIYIRNASCTYFKTWAKHIKHYVYSPSLIIYYAKQM